MDPLAEEYATFTPFQYVLNNPINLVDPYGLSPEEPGDPPCVDCSASVILPEIVITAKRDGKNYDQTPVRYGYNGTWSQYQKEFKLTGWDYDNYNSYYNSAHRDDFNNYVAAQDKAQSDRDAVGKMSFWFETVFQSVATVVSPSGVGEPINGANYFGAGFRTFKHTLQYSGIRTSLIDNSYFVNTRDTGYWAQKGHAKFPTHIIKWIIQNGKMIYNPNNSSWNFSMDGYKNANYGKFSLGIRRDGGIFHSTFYEFK